MYDMNDMEMRMYIGDNKETNEKERLMHNKSFIESVLKCAKDIKKISEINPELEGVFIKMEVSAGSGSCPTISFSITDLESDIQSGEISLSFQDEDWKKANLMFKTLVNFEKCWNSE